MGWPRFRIRIWMLIVLVAVCAIGFTCIVLDRRARQYRAKADSFMREEDRCVRAASRLLAFRDFYRGIADNIRRTRENDPTTPPTIQNGCGKSLTHLGTRIWRRHSITLR
jgi:hypothetical protein